MKIGCLYAVVLVFTFGCTTGKREKTTFFFPAEWEAHDAVWVSFFGTPEDAVTYRIVQEIARTTPVKCLVPGVDLNNNPTHRIAYAVRANLNAAGVDLRNIEIITVEGQVQTRDTGPIFLKNSAGAITLLSFRWNNYGDPFRSFQGFKSRFDSLMAAQLNVPLVESPVVMEGGAMEVNGKGTLLQVESVTLQRNPDLSKEEIEAELKQALGQKKVIWLKEGPAEDPHGEVLITDDYLGTGVGGHIDEFCRFVNAHTILLAMPDSAEAAENPVKRITYERMRVNYNILKNETDQDGRPFEIITIPVPDVPYPYFLADTTQINPEYLYDSDGHSRIQHGDTLYWVPASSYLNFFVTNNVVLIPEFWQQGLPQSTRDEDALVREMMTRYFPDRTIVSINPIALNDTGGGIHCWTQQQPARN